MIGLDGCQGCSVSSLGAHAILLVLSCAGSDVNIVYYSKVVMFLGNHLNLLRSTFLNLLA